MMEENSEISKNFAILNPKTWFRLTINFYLIQPSCLFQLHHLWKVFSFLKEKRIVILLIRDATDWSFKNSKVFKTLKWTCWYTCFIQIFLTFLNQSIDGVPIIPPPVKSVFFCLLFPTDYMRIFNECIRFINFGYKPIKTFFSFRFTKSH